MPKVYRTRPVDGYDEPGAGRTLTRLQDERWSAPEHDAQPPVSRPFGSPAARAAAPGLLAHYPSAGDGRSPEQYLRISTRPQFQDILRAAPTSAVDPDIDADDVFDIMLGAILARTIVPTVAAPMLAP